MRVQMDCSETTTEVSYDQGFGKLLSSLPTDCTIQTSLTCEQREYEMAALWTTSPSTSRGESKGQYAFLPV